MWRFTLLFCSLVVLSVVADKPPANGLPNIDTMEKGFDMLKGQPILAAMRASVFNFTYSDAMYNFNSQSYVIPNGIDVVSLPSFNGDNSAQIYISEESLQTGLSISFAIGDIVDDVFGVYAGSSLSHSFQQSLTKSQYTSTSFQLSTLWQASTLKKAALSDNFQSDLSALPLVFNAQTCSNYLKFFQTYGTHYLNAAIYGGAATMKTTFSSVMYNETSKSEITDSINTMMILVLQSTLSAQEQQQLNQLKATFSSSILLVGGDPSQYNPSQFSVWTKTIPANPVPIQVNSEPLWTLVDAGSDLQLALENATRSYCALLDKSNSWRKLQNMPIARSKHASVVIEGQIYSAGGSDPKNSYNSLFQVYYPDTDSWQKLKDMPTDRYGLGAAANNGVMFAIGGYDYWHHRSSNEGYYPDNLQWKTSKDMPTDRDYLSVVNANGIIYAIGGSDGSTLSKVEAFNPSKNSWSTLNSIQTPRESFAAVSINGLVYCMGGSNKGDILSSMEVFDSSTNVWVYLQAMPTPRYGHAATVLNGLIYAIGGSNGTGELNIVEIYDPVTNTWTAGVPMITPRKYLTASTVGNAIYAIGGDRSGQPCPIIEVFTPPVPDVIPWPCSMP